MSECAITTVSRAPKRAQDPDTALLADHTTFRVGGPAARFEVARTADDVVRLVGQADEAGTPVLILGDGSNLLISDEGFDGLVVQIAITGLHGNVSDCGGAVVRVGAGENWDDFVSYAVEQQWSGIEVLSGIPGSVGATPIQNVGAYGAEISEFVYSVRTYDRKTRQFHTFAAVECGFGYRDSIFKRSAGRYVVVEVTFQFPLGEMSAPVRYEELANRLGVSVGERALASQVRQRVLTIRGEKGMVLDSTDHDSWSAGSFFMNPVLDEAAKSRLPEGAPVFPAGEGKIKTSAAWLIGHSGFSRGFNLGSAGLSSKHVLAITNRGGASAEDLISLARKVREGVFESTGILLEPEVNLVGLSL